MKKQYFEDSEIIDKVFAEENLLEGLTPPNVNTPIFKMMPGKAKAIQSGECPMCGKKINSKEFKDELSKKEYSISGLCQKCQEKVFTEETYISEATKDAPSRRSIITQISELTGVSISDFDMSLARLADAAEEAFSNAVGENWPKNLPTPSKLEDDGKDKESETLSNLVREYAKTKI